jgi:biopolymer transport protein ExbD
MNLRKFDRQEPDVNLTPLIDVVFLLLIFFMVSTTFTRESRISIDLPESSAEPVESEETSIEVTIDDQGRYYVNQQLVVNKKIETLKQAIRLAVSDKENPALIINADAKSTHQAVITAMDAARQLGIVHLSLATRHSDSKR